jgi:hypothetical protein
MNNTIKPTVLFLCILLVACNKKPKNTEDPYVYYDGVISATRNGAAWSPKIGVAYDSINNKSKFSVHIADLDSTTDVLTINNIPCIIALDTIISYAKWSSTTDVMLRSKANAFYNGSFGVGSDIANANYLSDDVTPAMINISYYNAATNEVKGTFQVSFRRAHLTVPYSLDSVVYRNCSFSGKIHTYQEFYE